MLAYRRPVALLGVARDHAANTVYLMHPETGIPAQMPTAAVISEISAGDMPTCNHSELMLFRISFPVICTTRSQPVLSPT
jgi:hypothetical protein